MTMIWVRRALPAAALIFLCAQTTPPANPVVAHFRAYQAALQANDLATADTEATAALAASVARDGQGGRTGVLAINLAQLRLMRGRAAEAYEPAQQALQISGNADSGVDPLLARLTLGRAELTEQRYRQGRDRIEAALRDALVRPDLHSEAYNAASELGLVLLREGNHGGAADAWREAIRFADLLPENTTYIRAESRLGFGIAQYWSALDAQRSESERGDTSIRVYADREFGAARNAFIETGDILSHLAHQRRETDPELTGAQRLFARAVAWRNVVDSYLFSTGQNSALTRLSGDTPPPGPNGVKPECDFDVDTSPMPVFPANARARINIGATVVRILLDEAGNVQDTRVAGSVPEEGFADAVAAVAPRWTVTRSAENDPDCRMPQVVFHSIQFRFD